jgi:hypothetical protein
MTLGIVRPTYIKMRAPRQLRVACQFALIIFSSRPTNSLAVLGRVFVLSRPRSTSIDSDRWCKAHIAQRCADPMRGLDALGF